MWLYICAHEFMFEHPNANAFTPYLGPYQYITVQVRSNTFGICMVILHSSSLFEEFMTVDPYLFLLMMATVETTSAIHEEIKITSNLMTTKISMSRTLTL